MNMRLVATSKHCAEIDINAFFKLQRYLSKY